MTASDTAPHTGKPPANPAGPPPVVHILGWLGAVAFIAFGVGTWLLDNEAAAFSARAVMLYGAIILSFMGGVHWGLAMARHASGTSQPPMAQPIDAQFIASVIPALIAWAALLLPPAIGVPVLAIAFVLLLVFDLYSVRGGTAPQWYPTLRIPLTVCVTASLMIAWAAR